MSITTRTGDQGRTCLYSGQEVSKADLVPQALGALDEAISILGIARSLCPDAELNSIILEVQQTCFVVGSELATHPDQLDRLTRRLDEALLQEMESLRDQVEAETPMPKDFVVPGGNTLGAHLDHARTVFRRCEREAVRLQEAGFLQNPRVLQWLNRVSDLLWLLARQAEGCHVTARIKK
jgi:cob(I)alamin adenosyltransferase